MTTNYFLQTTDNSTNATSTQFVKSDWDGTTTGVWTDTAIAQWEVEATINNMVYMLDATKTSSRVMNLASSSVIEVTLPQAVDGLVNDVSDTGLIAFYSATPTVPTRLNSYLGEWSSYPVSSGTFSGFTSATGGMVLRSGTKLLSMSSSTLYSFETTTGVVTTTDVAAACSEPELRPLFAANSTMIFGFSKWSSFAATTTVNCYSVDHAGAFVTSAALTTVPYGSSYVVANAIANSSSVDVFATVSGDQFFSSYAAYASHYDTDHLDLCDHSSIANGTFPVIGSTQVKFGAGAASFDATHMMYTDYIASTDDYLANDFTAECWAYRTASLSATRMLFGRRSVNQSTLSRTVWSIRGDGTSSGVLGSVCDGVTEYTTAVANAELNTWIHFALVRNGATIAFYKNGTTVGTTALPSATTQLNTNPLSQTHGYAIGFSDVFTGGSWAWLGYLDDPRAVNGIAMYLDDFTAPAQAFITSTVSSTWVGKLDIATSTTTDISTAFSTYTLPGEYAIFQNGATNMAFLSPFPKFIASDQTTGARLSGALLYTYLAGGSTPAATYTDSAATTANANPVVCDSNGEADVWLDPANLYKFVLKTSAGVTQWTVDNVGGPSTYGQTAFAQTFLAASTAAAGRLVLGFPTIAAKGALIAGTAANTLGALAVGTDGQYLVAQSSQATGLQWSTVAAATAKGLLNVTSYATAGSFTYAPATTTVGSILVYAVGGGGSGGASAAATLNPGGGGGGGGMAIARLSTSQTGTSQTITVGAGGAAVAATNDGNAGSTSSLGTLCVAGGGSGGAGSSMTGGTSGVGSTGDVLVAGGDGGAGMQAGGGTRGGTGGSSPMGGGGRGTVGAGDDGGQYGGGGGGSTNGANSGAGASGVVVIYEYAI